MVELQSFFMDLIKDSRKTFFMFIVLSLLGMQKFTFNAIQLTLQLYLCIIKQQQKPLKFRNVFFFCQLKSHDEENPFWLMMSQL